MKRRNVRFLRGLAFRLAVWLVVLVLVPALALADLEIRFMNVGQGDCTIVECDGKAMIIDGGPADVSGFLYSYIRNDLKLRHVDVVISTHPHADHVGGLGAVLNAVPADVVYSPVTRWDSAGFRSLLRYADRQGTPVVVPETGDVLELGGATVTILSCIRDISGWGSTSVNDMSTVVRIDYGRTAFIIAADAEFAAEQMMLSSGLPLKADVLRIGHHGSRTATCEEFLETVSPSFAVISCGRGNDYGHPHRPTLSRLQKRNITLFRTDLQGNILCRSDGKTVAFSTDWQARTSVYAAPQTGS